MEEGEEGDDSGKKQKTVEAAGDASRNSCLRLQMLASV